MSYLPTATGQNPKKQLVNIPVSGNAAMTNTPLAANGTWTSGWLSTEQYGGAEISLYADVDGSYTLSFSQDGGETVARPSITVAYQSALGTRKGQFSVDTTWIKFDYTNGAQPQSKFLFKQDFLIEPPAASAETLNAMGSDTRTALWTKSRLETKTADGTNDYAPIYRQGNALRVHVDNPSSSSIDTSTLAKDGTDATGVTPPAGGSGIRGWLSGIYNRLGSLSVTISNFPASQAVVTPIASSATVTSINTVTASTQVLAANPNRKGATFFSVTGTILVKFGTSASATSYSVRIVTNGLYELDIPYTGVVTASGAGTLLVTEFS